MITPYSVVKKLNEMLELDKDAVETIFNSRVRWTGEEKSLEVHVVGSRKYCSMLSFINVIFGFNKRTGHGYVAAMRDKETNSIVEFVVHIGDKK